MESHDMGSSMRLREFADRHVSALEGDEERHHLMLFLIGSALHQPEGNLRCWTLGTGAACAVQSPGWPLVLGTIDPDMCRDFAAATRDLAYPAVIGPRESVAFYVDEAVRHGRSFGAPVDQQIYAMRAAPGRPECDGVARPVTTATVDLFTDWALAFEAEADLHRPPSARQDLAALALNGDSLFWTVDGVPVSLASVSRRTRRTASISRVYTPPIARGRGYAGAVTAAQAARVMAQGKPIAVLFADLANPAANRCYQRIGFEPVCRFAFFPAESPAR